MTAPNPPSPSMPESTPVREFEAWEDVPELNPFLMRGLYGYGFEKPSPIQQKSILSIVDGRDVIAQAQSGSGKTGAFATGALNRVRLDIKQPQAPHHRAHSRVGVANPRRGERFGRANGWAQRTTADRRNFHGRRRGGPESKRATNFDWLSGSRARHFAAPARRWAWNADAHPGRSG